MGVVLMYENSIFKFSNNFDNIRIQKRFEQDGSYKRKEAWENNKIINLKNVFQLNVPVEIKFFIKFNFLKTIHNSFIFVMRDFVVALYSFYFYKI